MEDMYKRTVQEVDSLKEKLGMPILNSFVYCVIKY